MRAQKVEQQQLQKITQWHSKHAVGEEHQQSWNLLQPSPQQKQNLGRVQQPQSPQCKAPEVRQSLELKQQQQQVGIQQQPANSKQSHLSNGYTNSSISSCDSKSLLDDGRLPTDARRKSVTFVQEGDSDKQLKMNR